MTRSAAARPVRLDVHSQTGDDFAEVTRVSAAAATDLPSSVTTAAGREHALHLERRSATGGLEGCLACGHPELYTKKDFNRAIGIAIVVIAAILVPFTPVDWRPYYPSLVAAALLDFLLFRFAPDVVVCYVCNSEHRDFPPTPRHPAFDRTIEERLLYGERAVMGTPMREHGTAGAPDPEH